MLHRNAIRKPHSFDWWQRFTDTYGCNRTTGKVNFYRGNKSPSEIIISANKISQEQAKQLSLHEPIYACGESCEPF